MTTKEERNARARDNQRLSRARRMDYIATLEEKIRHYERDGISATQQMQASARLVEKQNALLRTWVCRLVRVTEHELQEWLKSPDDMAEAYFNTAVSASGHHFRARHVRPSFPKSPTNTLVPAQYTSEPLVPDAPYLSQRKVDPPHENVQFARRVPFESIHQQGPARRSTGSWTEPRYEMSTSVPYASYPDDRRRSETGSQYHYDAVEYGNMSDSFSAHAPSPYTEPMSLGHQSLVSSSRYSLPLDSSFHARPGEHFPHEPYSVSYPQQQEEHQRQNP